MALEAVKGLVIVILGEDLKEIKESAKRSKNIIQSRYGVKAMTLEFTTSSTPSKHQESNLDGRRENREIMESTVGTAMQRTGK